MSKALTFQDVILRLERFWADHGCIIVQPYNEKVGAGTMNPATFLRVLGPEPWNVAYVEPSVRPDDGRYGENPNRMQLHTQYQVILKPDPGNPMELYLDSLAALGIDRDQHDIRFVEDNWAAPALGAWGLGWEVWLDGLEITQFTYFQQAGGIPLDPVSVEITYGLERIAMFLQGVRQVWDLAWDGQRTYGDLMLQPEIENCRYEFEVADVKRLGTMYELFEAEAKSCLAHHLVIPAHDYVLRCSHTFNLLDSRGAIGVTERASYFRRMRDLARQVALQYVEQRTGMEFPWLNGGDGALEGSSPPPPSATTSTRTSPALSIAHSPEAIAPADFLLEIGTEELPSADVATAREQLESAVPKWLDEARLDMEQVRVLATPRRLLVHVHNLAGWQREEEKLVKGPPARAAFDPSGAPTRAAEGFARAQGVSVESLEVQDMDGGRYVVARKRAAGRAADDVLADILPDWIAALSFGKTMRWNRSGVAFSRPIRWLVALYGDRVIPFRYAGVTSGRVTRGPRPHGSPDILLNTVADYFEALTGLGVVLDVEQRRAFIADQITELASIAGGAVPNDPDLLAEVTNLVEVPTALRGDFDPAYLELPSEVLVTVMKKHQRYFPILRHDTLMPAFLTVRNGGSQYLNTVKAGNEAVLRARYADAAYFWRADASKPLESYLPRLATLAFQEQLGSMLDKSHRLEDLTPKVGRWLQLTEEDLAAGRRAAHLAKADLATQMVVELTSLQGIMGRYYAALSGESPEVAQAIGEQYWPRFTGDKLPQSGPGAALALADRLDSLVGLFAVGLAPTGSADPYALRRAALGVNLILIDYAAGRHGESFSLREAVAAAADLQPVSVSPQVQQAVLDFIAVRLRSILLDAGYRYDIVDSVLSEQSENPAFAQRGVIELTAWVQRPDWPDILANYSRCVRITRDFEETFAVDPESFADPTVAQLWNALQAVNLRPGTRSVDEFLTAFTPLVPVIKNFFDRVLVMVDDRMQRENRLGLLQRIASLANGIVDLSKMEGF